MLASFYLVLASGLTLSLHYCGGKLKSVSLFSCNEDGCCGSKMKSKDCCKNKTTFIKVKDTHNTSKIAEIYSANTQLIAIVQTQLCNSPRIDEVYVTSNYYAPPVLYDKPLYLKHRVLII